MKKNKLLKIILLLVLAVSFAVYSSNVWDDDDATAGLAFDRIEPLTYDYLTLPVLSEIKLFCLNVHPGLSPAKIFYIAMHETSPPFPA